MPSDIQSLSTLQQFPFYLDYQKGVNFDILEGYTAAIFSPYAPIQVIEDTVDKAIRVRMDFTFYSRQELHSFLSFMDYHKGLLKKFWIYCNTNEFILKTNIPANDYSITCENSFYYLNFKTNDRIYLILNNGDTIVRKIQAVEPNQVGDTMTITTATLMPNYQILMNNVLEIGRVLCCRFDHGSFEVVNITPIVSQISLRFFELVKEYPA